MKTKSALFFSLILFIGCNSNKYIQPSNSLLEPTIKVMTYNIHHANPPSQKADMIDLDAVVDVILRSNADLIGLQELDSVTSRSNKVFQLKYLADKLGMNYYFGKSIPYQEGGYGVGILSKYPIIEEQTIPLPKDSNLESESRVIAIAKISLSKGNDIIFTVSHWDHTSEMNRILQAKEIISLSHTFALPVILTGDMNATPESGSVKILKQQFQNASSQNAPTIPNIKLRKKIDYVFFSKDKNISFGNETVITDAHYPSDHLPYVVELHLQTTNYVHQKK